MIVNETVFQDLQQGNMNYHNPNRWLLFRSFASFGFPFGYSDSTMVYQKRQEKNRRRAAAIRVALIFGLLVMLLTIFGCQESASRVVLSFPDPVLEEAIRHVIGIQTGDIHDSDMVGLTTLRVPDLGISNLEGIQHCTDLTTLELPHNQIRDISLLSELANLTDLSLSNNQIRDINPLSGLVNLTDLYLPNNQIRDISPLSGLINLDSLHLGNNQIRDISPLSGLVNLANLVLNDNQIEDIHVLVDNPALGYVALMNTDLNLRSGSQDMLDIGTLQGRGVYVDF
jgi:hypothetical protein